MLPLKRKQRTATRQDTKCDRLVVRKCLGSGLPIDDWGGSDNDHVVKVIRCLAKRVAGHEAVASGVSSLDIRHAVRSVGRSGNVCPEKLPLQSHWCRAGGKTMKHKVGSGWDCEAGEPVRDRRRIINGQGPL